MNAEILKEPAKVPSSQRKPVHSRPQKQPRETWSSRWTFIMAAAGSAVGLGNVWKFPYIAGEYGGGAFVLVYLACVALVGLPILLAEIAIGRRGGRSPVYCFRMLSRKEGHSRHWQIVGFIGIACAFLILSFYSVVAGWSLAYLGFLFEGRLFAAAGSEDVAGQMSALFSGLLDDPTTMLVCHSLVMTGTVAVVAFGVRRGLQRAVQLMVPGLFGLLILLVAYAAVTTGEFSRAFSYLFNPSFQSLTWEAVLVAMGHAFFTLSIGMTVMMAYGSMLEADVSIARSTLAIGGLDTLVATLAGLAIFPLVFAYGLEPDAGPGLLFVTLPVTLSALPGAGFFASAFFVFLLIAALTSTISVLEPVVEYLSERFPTPRWQAASLAGGLIWAVGLGSVVAFNIASDVTLFGRNFFDLLDFATANVLLPLGGLAVACYAGYVLPLSSLAAELDVSRGMVTILRCLLRYVSPVGVVIVLSYNLL